MKPADQTKDTEALAKALEEYNKAVAAYLKQIEIQRVRYSIKRSINSPSL